MNLTKIREEISNNKGKILHFRFNGNRNQIENFSGKIVDAYSKIFLIAINNEIRSYTYSDILINSLEIIKK
ncbi:MAG: hypothetical protein GX861_02515 [Tenericutes bacterium]|jgi:uncharacterized protein Veg|nr:hypothetical protein [Mycoplasmatota bacterium]